MKTLILLLLLTPMAFAQEASAAESQASETPPPLNDQQRAEFFKIAFEIRTATTRALEIENAARIEAQKAREVAAEAGKRLNELTIKLADGKPCQLQVADGEPAWTCPNPTTEDKRQ